MSVKMPTAAIVTIYEKGENAMDVVLVRLYAYVIGSFEKVSQQASGYLHRVCHWRDTIYAIDNNRCIKNGIKTSINPT